MAYEKQTWHTGDIITEGKLNHMEDGIANAGGITILSDAVFGEWADGISIPGQTFLWVDEAWVDISELTGGKNAIAARYIPTSLDTPFILVEQPDTDQITIHYAYIRSAEQPNVLNVLLPYSNATPPSETGDAIYITTVAETTQLTIMAYTDADENAYELWCFGDGIEWVFTPPAE